MSDSHSSSVSSLCLSTMRNSSYAHSSSLSSSFSSSSSAAASLLKMWLLWLVASWAFVRAEPPRDFYSDRDEILAAEELEFLGSDIVLNNDESQANDTLMRLKHAELDSGFERGIYPPAKSFFQAKEEIEASQVFSFLRGMPKGAALHTHDLSIASASWVIAELTYRENLYICEDANEVKFDWFSEPTSQGCNWVAVSQRRDEVGAQQFDEYLLSLLTINVDDPANVYPDINSVWDRFDVALTLMSQLLSYEPVYRAYFRQALEEFRQDNVQHLEIRTVLMDTVCKDLGPDCVTLTQLELTGLYQEEADAFLTANADMCAVRLIYAPVRSVTAETVTGYLDTVKQLLDRFPNFVAGFDLVGQEDIGRPLIDFVPQLQVAAAARPDLRYYFHAGETNWQGQSTDLNVIDALLLGTKRIGHGYAIFKHPEAMRLARERDVPLEVCPISNQVLGLVTDLRNHPASALIQESFPMVISSDDPATWRASGLSHDFYQAFMGLAARDMDLRLLKRLVFDSMKYSSLEGDDLNRCQSLLQIQWDLYTQRVAKEYGDIEISNVAALAKDEILLDDVSYPLPEVVLVQD